MKMSGAAGQTCGKLALLIGTAGHALMGRRGRRGGWYRAESERKDVPRVLFASASLGTLPAHPVLRTQPRLNWRRSSRGLRTLPKVSRPLQPYGNFKGGEGGQKLTIRGDTLDQRMRISAPNGLTEWQRKKGKGAQTEHGGGRVASRRQYSDGTVVGGQRHFS